MKNILRKLTFILSCSILLLFVSCNPTYPDDGFFKVGEKSYNINEAFLTDTGYDNGYYQLRLTMDNSNSYDSHSINFLFYSEVNEYLPSGIYVPYLYDDKYDNRFKRGAWMKGDVEAGAILKGRVKVTKSNDTYTVRIDCEDINGNPITGEYKGKIKVTY